ncbi:MAG TPA: universal stress protein [Terracidiphilus sp.]|nr:universal stress protein [Terracidiphilus sp.]
MFKRIAVAFDESPAAQRAFRAALELAGKFASELYLVTVVEDLPPYVGYISTIAPDMPAKLIADRHAFYADLHSRARATAEEAGIAVQSEFFEGNEIQGLLHLADRLHPDLLVVGLRLEPGGVNRYLGGTAHKLALHARCNILGVR